MTGTKKLVAIGREDNTASLVAADTGSFAETVAEQDAEYPSSDAWIDEADSETAPAIRSGWIMPVAAILAVVGWTGFFGWAYLDQIRAGGTPQQWAGWVVDWAVPVLLVMVVWLLAMRHSRRESARFADAARSLSHESTLLETRLTAVNRELSMARDFLASQSRDLEALGRVATERLTTNADTLQALILENTEQVLSISSVSATALENMERLRSDLPVVSNSARDMANQIGNAGIAARSQLGELVDGFDRLTQFGENTNTQVDGLRDRIAETLGSLSAQADNLDRHTQERFTALRQQSEDFRLEMDRGEVDALAGIRRRADELHQEFAARDEALQVREARAAAMLQQRIDELRNQGQMLTATLTQGQDDAARKWQAEIAALENRMQDAIARIEQVDQAAMANARLRLDELMAEAGRLDAAVGNSMAAFQSELEQRRIAQQEREQAALHALAEKISDFDAVHAERQQDHLAHISGLAERGEALNARLSDLDRKLAVLREGSAATSGELGSAADDLSRKLAESQTLMAASARSVSSLTDESVRLLELIRAAADHSKDDLPASLLAAHGQLDQFEDRTRELGRTIAEAEIKGAALAAYVEQARTDGSASLETIRSLESRLAVVAGQSGEISGKAREAMQQLLAELEDASTRMVTALREGQATAIEDLTATVAPQALKAMDEALRESTAAALEDLAEAARRAGSSGQQTVSLLRDQLGRVNELTGNLESRVAQAREKAEEQVDHDFTRRMALITESLNSSAIDISKAFDDDVSDTSWASYLRGDRGIFTRRAVNLIDNHSAKAVIELYETDGEFRETVNRYIHDFEAMLRTVLSTREGNALAVTLLSSNIGRLYVALAQAIDRLR